MTFPTIRYLDDVLPHIAGRSEFIHAQRDGYSVIDYNFALADSFDHPMRLECRGIKFAPDGRILARPLHKFMNLGETPETQPHLLDFSQPHVVTEKLDGSMIHPAIVNGELVLMTRMGRTDVAIKAERLLTERMRHWCLTFMGDWTPIFEFTAPDNRIVIRYEESLLSLLAVRHRVTGEYMEAHNARGIALNMGVPLVAHHPSDWNSGQAFADYARAVTGREGFVVRFDNGLWVKAKGEDYVLRHRAKDSILQEKNVLALVLRGEIDDVLPLLEPDDAGRVARYRDEVMEGMQGTAILISGIVGGGAHLSQKEFAVDHLSRANPALRPAAFMVRAGTPASDAVRRLIEKNLSSQTAVDAARHLHGATLAA